uniref:ISXO2-like transposase domain-containing protein n=1 Tax=Panagrolaimus superbus TaxID=310955 RepID=A0A914YHK4_9BILA
MVIRHGGVKVKRIDVQQVFELCYLWCYSHCTHKFAELCLENDDGQTISSKTLVNWKQYFRDLCAEELTDNPIIIGGPGIEVQIDETVITKRKYNRGRLPANEVWFLGGIEPISGRAFMTPVESRDRETLYAVIRRHIRPDSIIISDCWAAYATLGQLPEGYIHRTVNHSENFVDPVTGVHTNTIESLWQKFKLRHKVDYGTNRDLIMEYMNEFLWKKDRAYKDLFHDFWKLVVAKYRID